jgi:hypothetical protein
MSTSSVFSFEHKLNRADKHVEALKHETGAWVETNPYEIVDEPDPEPPLEQSSDLRVVYRRFRVSRIDPVPDSLLTIVGDCLFNIRSALDHLAFSLAKAYTPTMTIEQEVGSEFPIFHERPMKTGEEVRKIGCVHPGAAAVIKAMQPHHRGSLYRDEPLWQIQELNRVDKHRRLSVAVTHPEKEGHRAVGIAVTGNENLGSTVYMRSITQNFVPLKTDAVLVRYGAIPKDANRGVQMQPFLSIQILLGEGEPAPLEPIIPTLNRLCDFVRDGVIAPLSKFL